MKTYHIYGIGNALVDQEFEVDDSVLDHYGFSKGSRTLVSDHEFQELYFRIIERHPEGKKSCGGSAGNSIVTAAHLGANAFFTCKIANDEMGDYYRDDLVAANVDSNVEAVRESGNTGRCMVFITPDSERTMVTSLGISEDISMNEIVENSLLRSQYLYFEGYLATSDIAIESIRRAKQLARSANAKIAASLSDIKMILYFEPSMRELFHNDVDLLFANQQEAAQWTKTTNLKTMAYRLRHQFPTFVITLGADGAIVCDGKKVSKVKAPVVTPIDTVGAGDAFAGAFLYGITQGMDYKSAAKLACQAASRVVCQHGPRLSSDDYFELQQISKKLMG